MKLFKNKQNHTIGHLLTELDLVTGEQVDEALACQASGDDRPLGVILIGLGYVTAQQVEHALLVQRARRGNMPHEDGVRLLERAAHRAKQATSCIDELTLAAKEMVIKAKG